MIKSFNTIKLRSISKQLEILNEGGTSYNAKIIHAKYSKADILRAIAFYATKSKADLDFIDFESQDNLPTYDIQIIINQLKVHSRYSELLDYLPTNLIENGPRTKRETSCIHILEFILKYSTKDFKRNIVIINNYTQANDWVSNILFMIMRLNRFCSGGLFFITRDENCEIWDEYCTKIQSWKYVDSELDEFYNTSAIDFSKLSHDHLPDSELAIREKLVQWLMIKFTPFNSLNWVDKITNKSDYNFKKEQLVEANFAFVELIKDDRYMAALKRIVSVMPNNVSHKNYITENIINKD